MFDFNVTQIDVTTNAVLETDGCAYTVVFGANPDITVIVACVTGASYRMDSTIYNSNVNVGVWDFFK